VCFIRIYKFLERKDKCGGEQKKGNGKREGGAKEEKGKRGAKEEKGKEEGTLIRFSISMFLSTSGGVGGGSISCRSLGKFVS
jgi:hypothetical protein